MSLAHQPQAEKKIQLLLTSLFASRMQKGGFDVQSDRGNLTVSSSVVFFDKEISAMASTFKKIFIANGLAAHVLKKPCGKNNFCYEIRYRSNGYNIRASSTDLSEAKRKFLHKTTPKEIEKYRVQEKITGTNALQNVFDEWLRYKKGTVTDKTLQSFHTNFSALPESLRNTPITGVRTGDIEKY